MERIVAEEEENDEEDDEEEESVTRSQHKFYKEYINELLKE